MKFNLIWLQLYFFIFASLDGKSQEAEKKPSPENTVIGRAVSIGPNLRLEKALVNSIAR